MYEGYRRKQTPYTNTRHMNIYITANKESAFVLRTMSITINYSKYNQPVTARSIDSVERLDEQELLMIASMILRRVYCLTNQPTVGNVTLSIPGLHTIILKSAYVKPTTHDRIPKYVLKSPNLIPKSPSDTDNIQDFQRGREKPTYKWKQPNETSCTNSRINSTFSRIKGRAWARL